MLVGGCTSAVRSCRHQPWLHRCQSLRPPQMTAIRVCRRKAAGPLPISSGPIAPTSILEGYSAGAGLCFTVLGPPYSCAHGKRALPIFPVMARHLPLPPCCPTLQALVQTRSLRLRSARSRRHEPSFNQSRFLFGCLGRNLQPFTSPDSFDALVIDEQAGMPQQFYNPAIAIAAVVTGERDDVGCKPGFIFSAARRLALR